MHIQIITALLGSLGFSLLFGLRPRYLCLASLGGGICWAFYQLCLQSGLSVFVTCLVASAFSALYGEILARIMKAPAPLFFIPTVIPLIPGSTLYYTMRSAVQGQLDLAADYGMQTLLSALAIAAGVSLVWSVFFMADRVEEYLKKK
ncbi:MAG: threonine/serine exporter [Ruminococcus sp.]|nr:threonine/serine exporter [Ruminococcus sp.]